MVAFSPAPTYQPRGEIDTAGFNLILANLRPWPRDASLETIAESWRQTGPRIHSQIDQRLSQPHLPVRSQVEPSLGEAAVLNGEGRSQEAYQVLARLRAAVEREPEVAARWLYSIVFFQGVTALRRGETENCVLCRGECSCILPLAPAAVHTNPAGARLAVEHFTEYLHQFPDDLEVRWLLNVTHMTLGEHPRQVEPRFRLTLEPFLRSEFDIGRFRDVGALVGVNRLNQAGGAIMEDFDNDGLLDLAVTSMDPSQRMALYHNTGAGAFEERSEEAGLARQVGGLNCVQADYNNDGHTDILILRGAWLPHPMPPSLLRNNGDGTFTDVTAAAGLATSLNTITGAWADYDNDGFLDLFVCCERQANRLYRNRGDGTFEEVAGRAGLVTRREICKGAAWLDYDNDGYPDLFLNMLNAKGRLFHNDRDGTFTEVTREMGIVGPQCGFLCWAWDYDNDGWQDIFATSYDFTLGDVVLGLEGKPHNCPTSKLFRNLAGQGFQDVTRDVGLDMVFGAMAGNFGDFDNDGHLDLYLGTGGPDFSLLIPNRMFKNVAGRRFAEITASSGTGHLQKGHGTACGDWDRDGDLDLFLELGGAIDGDRYHNVLFQNPGQGHNWLTVKLVGRQTNRSAIGARIKVVTATAEPMTLHRHVSSGGSFGASSLQQTIGLAGAERVALLEVHWPTSGTTQVFRDVAVNQAVEVTEFETDYRALPWTPTPTPR